jgi:hypothetical protein
LLRDDRKRRGEETESPIRRMGMTGGSLADLNYGRCARRELAALVEHGLLDHLGRLEEQRLRDREAESLGGLAVDHKLESCRLQNR